MFKTVYPIAARVLVDGRDEAIVRAVFPEGSTSYSFPHYMLTFVGGGEAPKDWVCIAMKRVGVERSFGRSTFTSRKDHA